MLLGEGVHGVVCLSTFPYNKRNCLVCSPFLSLLYWKWRYFVIHKLIKKAHS